MTIRRQRSHDNYITDRHSACVELLRDFRDQKIDRRTFMAGIATLLTVAAVPLVVSVDAVAASDVDAALSKQPWLTFAAVQDHLFPTSKDSPGAKDINATAYLRRVLAEAHTDPDEKNLINNGVGWLNDIAREKQGKPFIELSADQRETVLRTIARSNAGERWLSLLLVYIFEALLSDPVYGGNPEGIGWQWLEHRPGFPRPPADKTYFKL